MREIPYRNRMWQVTPFLIILYYVFLLAVGLILFGILVFVNNSFNLIYNYYKRKLHLEEKFVSTIFLTP